eukprot:TRINITY_DN12130_c0_g1_i2.p1 TRINITY_DN12130_c0_g1~~TRINITY_DN12130_c0_g1_i2.p1  ORF type:complete len:224 (-),score=66.45 TRINITY_DN12130_c0_g1_i2:518-1189(-)
MVEESTPEELEPLFDYRRVQPVDFVYLDDDDVLDSPPIFAPKRKRIPSPTVEKEGEDCKFVDFVDEKEKDEEDWLPPPPKMPVSRAGFEEDPTIKELRLKKQELASFAQSAEDVMRAVEESARKEISKLGRSALEPEGDQPSKVTGEREKIVITIQDKDEQKKFCVFKDDRFERLFKMYAEKTKSDIESLVFCFDGDKVNPSSSPKSLELEDEDIIEVHHKSR